MEINFPGNLFLFILKDFATLAIGHFSALVSSSFKEFVPAIIVDIFTTQNSYFSDGSWYSRQYLSLLLNAVAFQCPILNHNGLDQATVLMVFLLNSIAKLCSVHTEPF